MFKAVEAIKWQVPDNSAFLISNVMLFPGRYFYTFVTIKKVKLPLSTKVWKGIRLLSVGNVVGGVLTKLTIIL